MSGNGAVSPVLAVVALAAGCGDHADSDAEEPIPRAALETTPAAKQRLMACSEEPFPAATLERPAVAETKRHPSDEALRRELKEDDDLPDDAWWLAYRTPREVQYLHDNGETILEALLRRRGRAWELYFAGVCDLRAFHGSAEVGRWSLDQDAPPPEPDSRVLHLIIEGQACTSGRGPAGRIRPLLARYSEEEIELTVLLDPISGPQTCEGYPGVRRPVVLDEPLGDRTLLDASVYPPVVPGEPAFPLRDSPSHD